MWFICFLIVFLGVFIFMSYRYRNPYKLTLVFGKKGAGKTSYLASLAFRYKKKKWPVYSTVPIPGTIPLDVDLDLKDGNLPEKSVILIDEVGLIWDNRDFKNFKHQHRDYFKYQRHNKHIVYLFSQTFDVDVKIRTLVDRMYLLVNPFGWFSILRTISRSMKVVEPTADSEGRVADSLRISGFFGLFIGTTKIVFIPRWVRYFNSFSRVEDDFNLKLDIKTNSNYNKK